MKDTGDDLTKTKLLTYTSQCHYKMKITVTTKADLSCINTF